MDPPPLPTTKAELAEWSVYGDYLQTRGDPRGELIARDLALPEQPEAAPLRAFHALAQRRCGERRGMAIGWCLGHARVIALPPARPHPGTVVPRSPEPSTLASVRDLLREPVGARLEELHALYVPRIHPRHWRRLFAALPATCTRVGVIGWRIASTDDLDELLSMLPHTVRELSIGVTDEPSEPHMLRSIDDRFAVVELMFPQPTRDDIRSALERTRTVRVRSDHPLDHPRWERAYANAAALVGRAGLDVAVLRPWSLPALQRYYGIIGVRAQLACTPPEGYELGVRYGRVSAGATSVCHPSRRRRTPRVKHLVRRGMQWTVRASPGLRIWRGHREIVGIEEVHDREPLTVQQLESRECVECVFAARDVDAMLRSA